MPYFYYVQYLYYTISSLSCQNFFLSFFHKSGLFDSLYVCVLVKIIWNQWKVVKSAWDETAHFLRNQPTPPVWPTFFHKYVLLNTLYVCLLVNQCKVENEHFGVWRFRALQQRYTVFIINYFTSRRVLELILQTAWPISYISIFHLTRPMPVGKDAPRVML